MTEPLISVVIPAFNRSAKIERALKSVQNQTYANWEAVVVDDASKDNTVDIVKEMSTKDKRIVCVRHSRNKGSQAARNTGIRCARGQWVAFLDSDDEFLTDSLSSRMDMLIKEHTNAVHSNAYILHTNKPKIVYYSPPYKGEIYKDILIKDGPTFPSLLVQRRALENIGYLDEEILAFQEWDTYIRLGKQCKFSFLPKETFIYDYTGSDSISRDDIRGARGYGQILHKHFWNIWLYGGARALGFHYSAISQRYSMGGDKLSSLRYRLNALVWKCFSFSIILKKLKKMVPAQ